MKKTMVYLLTLTMLFSLLLGGCGERDSVKRPAASAAPKETSAPGTMTPDPEDGIVKDEDGIITDDDTGTVTPLPENTAAPEGKNDMDSSTEARQKSTSGDSKMQ